MPANGARLLIKERRRAGVCHLQTFLGTMSGQAALYGGVEQGITGVEQSFLEKFAGAMSNNMLKEQIVEREEACRFWLEQELRETLSPEFQDEHTALCFELDLCQHREPSRNPGEAECTHLDRVRQALLAESARLTVLFGKCLSLAHKNLNKNSTAEGGSADKRGPVKPRRAARAPVVPTRVQPGRRAKDKAEDKAEDKAPASPLSPPRTPTAVADYTEVDRNDPVAWVREQNLHAALDYSPEASPF